MGKTPARWRHGGLLLCPSADGHPPGLRFPQETKRKSKFLGSPTKRQPLALASRPHSPFSCPARNGRRKGEKTNDRANQRDPSRSIGQPSASSAPPTQPFAPVLQATEVHLKTADGQPPVGQPPSTPFEHAHI